MKEQLEAFLADLVEVCRKHNMAIIEDGPAGIMLIPYSGWDEQRHEIIIYTPTPAIRVREIAPNGPHYGFTREGYDYEGEARYEP